MLLLWCIEDVFELHFNPRTKIQATLDMNRQRVIDGVSGTTQNTKMLLINSEEFLSTLPHDTTEGKIKYQLFPKDDVCLWHILSHLWLCITKNLICASAAPMRAIKLTIFNFFTFLRLINNECNLILHPTNHRVLYGMKVEKKSGYLSRVWLSMLLRLWLLRNPCCSLYTEHMNDIWRWFFFNRI